MIRNQWYVVLESNEVGTRPVGVTRLGEKMVFWRDQAGKVNAAVDRCPHRGVALSVGKTLVPIPGTRASSGHGGCGRAVLVYSPFMPSHY